MITKPHFCRPVTKPRFTTRENCAKSTLPVLTTLWPARANNLIRQAAASEEHKNQATKPPKQPWRIEARLPTSAARNQPKPKRPSELHPDLHPTRERVLFPWEADLTDIEWAVQNHIQKEFPDAYKRIIDLALKHSGLVDIKEDPQ